MTIFSRKVRILSATVLPCLNCRGKSNIRGGLVKFVLILKGKGGGGGGFFLSQTLIKVGPNKAK